MGQEIRPGAPAGDEWERSASATQGAPGADRQEAFAANRLGLAASAYLRSARHQPVFWHEWGEAAFARAKREDKPVLLDIGAVWCHWCHVMDRESYEDPALAALINAEFVAVKVDRDERPDVDTRLQAAVAAISGQGGWPLTAFLTPDGHPYFGGTYFPPEERYGQPSFRRVLHSMAEVYRSQRGEVTESAESVMTAIEEGEMLRGHTGELRPALLDTILASILGQFDSRNGGFGAQPKFPHAAALDLLIDAAGRPGAVGAQAAHVVRFTLERMAAGGIQDHLAGGFHRYATDEHWTVPHFEKMAYDNSELLRVYTHAFQSFLDPQFARVAAGIIGWMDTVLSDRERGGFYAAQDADSSHNDDGGYFTWSLAEVEAVLRGPELEAARAFFNIRPVGDMPHDPARNVLRQSMHVPGVAARLAIPQQAAQELVETARQKLLAARLRRPTPFVDRTLYTGWNGLCISAYLAAGRALALPAATAFALKSLDRVLTSARNASGDLRHVVAYAEVGVPDEGVPAVLDDYVFLATACVDAWEATGNTEYLRTAEGFGDTLLTRFYDEADGGFLDMPQASSGRPPLGALEARRKPLQDAPTPGGNPAAASLLLRLHALTGAERWRTHAVKTLETFAGVAEHLGLYAGSYAQALRRVLSAPVQVCVIGTDELAEELYAAATAGFQLNKSVIRLRPEQMSDLPPALAATLPSVIGVVHGSVALVCQGATCQPPVNGVEKLLGVLREGATADHLPGISE